MSIDLDAIKARLAAACPGPWRGFTFRRPIDGNCYVIVREDDPHVIAATLVPQYGDNDTAVMLLHAREDMDALVAEVKRLRGERDHFREAWAAAQVRIDLGTDALEAVRGERAAVVAWLRDVAETMNHNGDKCCGRVEDLAEAIERGEHRREEEP